MADHQVRKAVLVGNLMHEGIVAADKDGERPAMPIQVLSEYDTPTRVRTGKGWQRAEGGEDMEDSEWYKEVAGLMDM